MDNPKHNYRQWNKTLKTWVHAEYGREEQKNIYV